MLFACGAHTTAPLDGACRPCGHETHAAASDVRSTSDPPGAPTRPAGHAVHTADAGVSVKDPGRHGPQSKAAPLSRRVPVSQEQQMELSEHMVKTLLDQAHLCPLPPTELVLDAQRQLYSSQLDLAEAIRDRFTATADLFKALGGGWTENSDSLNDGLEAVRDSYAPQEKDSAQSDARNVSE